MASPHHPDQYSPQTPSPMGSGHRPPVGRQPPPASSSSSASSLPLLAITIVGILTTILLLVTYYVFVLKCRRRRGQHDDILRRLTGTGSGRSTLWLPPFTLFTTPAENHGLDESAIQSIPTIRYRSQDGRPFHECAVCLNEFKEEEKLRLLPGCSHAFHIDCIDIWLQFNANCPLCRLDITAPIPTHHQISTRATLDSPHSSESIVIDVQEDGSNRNLARETPPKPREPRSGSKKGRKMLRSMGDECIDVRNKDAECSAMQPIRRSLSMDSSADRQLYLSVQEIFRRNEQQFPVQECGGGSGEEGGSSSSTGGAKIRRSFFSFGHGRSLRSTAVLPV